MSTSFQKKTRGRAFQIPGTKPSLYNNQLLISTGVPSLDNVIGGGMAVGTVLLVEEDVYGSYSQLLLKYFCAEAVLNGHGLLVSSSITDPRQLLKELPDPILDDPGPDVRNTEPEVLGNKGTGDTEHMKIAWRYRHLPKFQSNPSAVKFGHYYDLTKTMDPSWVEMADITTVPADMLETDSRDAASMNAMYSALLRQIDKKIDHGKFSTGMQGDKRNILRIAVQSLGSPLWGECGGLTSDDQYDPSLPRFLLCLRAILRSAYAVCVLTMPTHLFCDPVFTHRVEQLCDTVVQLDSFAGSDKEKNPVYKDYHGLLNIRRLPRLNSLVCHMPESLDLAFKLRRKKFTIEKLHLPPELSETTGRSQEDPVPTLGPHTGCGVGGGTHKLDF